MPQALVPVQMPRPPLLQAVTAVTPPPAQQTASLPHVEMNFRQPGNPDVRVMEVPPAPQKVSQQFLREGVVELPQRTVFVPHVARQEQLVPTPRQQIREKVIEVPWVEYQ